MTWYKKSYATLSRDIPWNIPLVTFIFLVYTLALIQGILGIFYGIPLEMVVIPANVSGFAFEKETALAIRGSSLA